MSLKPLLRTLLLLSLTPQLICPVNPANLTGDSGAILTDVHNRVEKRNKIDWERQIWGALLPGKLGDLLPEGTQVGTGDKSWAQISWPKVTTRIWEETVVAIAPNKRIVHLLDGEMLFNLDKNHKVTENCEVWTKLLSARVHGTTFIVQSTADFSRVSVLEGNLDVTNRLDNSVVSIGPGVVYEVRTGASPPATWLKPERMPSDSSSQPSNLTPLTFDAPRFGAGDNSGGNNGFSPNNAYPVGGRAAGQLKHSEQEIQAKAEEMSRADPAKKQAALQRLRKMNIEETEKENRWLAQKQQEQKKWSQQQNWKQQQNRQQTWNPQSNFKPSLAEMQKKADEMSGGDAQKKQYLLNKMRQQLITGNGPKPFGGGSTNYSAAPQDNGLRNFQTITPFVDTSEFAPIRTAQAKKQDTKSSGKSSKKSHFIEDFSSHAVPPISLFRTTNSATNLYLADVNQLWKHRLLQGYSSKLESIPIVQSELFSLPPISRQESYFRKNADDIARRNAILAAQARIIQAPKDKVQQIGREMANANTLPGQTSAPKSDKEANSQS